MESNDLKMFALFYIKEQKLSDKGTIRLMNFIECAGDEEILFLLATGHIPSENNTIVRESEGKVYRIEEIKTKDIAHGLSHAYMYTAPNITAMSTMIAMKVKKEKMAKLSAKCEKEKGAARKTCYNMIRRDAIRAQIRALNSMKTKCHKAKTSETCIKHIDAKMKNLQQRMDAIKVSA